VKVEMHKEWDGFLENGRTHVFAASFFFQLFAIRTENGFQTGTAPPTKRLERILEKWYMVQMQYFN
jgi:hypothetical protein